MFYICNIINGDGNRLKQMTIPYYDNIFITENVSEINKKIPTLFIGYNFIKKLGIKFDPLTKTIKNNKYYWTFNEEENYIESINDFKSFILNSKKYYWNSINYKFIDPIFDNISNINDFKKYTNSKIKKLYFSETINTIYLKLDKEYIIINNDIFEFFNFNLKDLLNFFKDNSFYMIKGTIKNEKKIKKRYQTENDHLVSIIYLETLINK